MQSIFDIHSKKRRKKVQTNPQIAFYSTIKGSHPQSKTYFLVNHLPQQQQPLWSGSLANTAPQNITTARAPWKICKAFNWPKHSHFPVIAMPPSPTIIITVIVMMDGRWGRSVAPRMRRSDEARRPEATPLGDSKLQIGIMVLGEFSWP